MVPAPGQIGENTTGGNVTQQNTEYIDMYTVLFEEVDSNVSGTISKGNSRAAYVGELIKISDDIIREHVGIETVIVKQHSSQFINWK